MSTPGIYNAVINMIATHAPVSEEKMLHLDIGAGRSELITELQKKIVLSSTACDYHIKNFLLPDIPVKQVDINLGHSPMRTPPLSW